LNASSLSLREKHADVLRASHSPASGLRIYQHILSFSIIKETIPEPRKKHRRAAWDRSHSQGFHLLMRKKRPNAKKHSNMTTAMIRPGVMVFPLEKDGDLDD
jgi:hypothetical protein